MYFTLAVFAGLVGLLVTAASVYTAWYSLRLLRKEKSQAGEAAEAPNGSGTSPVVQALLKWTVLDYSLVGLFAIGALFLLVDAIAVVRDRALYTYPFYHLGYLVSGLIFVVISMLFLLARLFLILRLAGTPRVAASNDHHEPSHADDAE